jgi:predicted DNA binding protein
MSICEANLEISMNSHLCDITDRFPESKVMVWCNANIHMYELHSGNEETLDRLEEESDFFRDKSVMFKRSGMMRMLSSECDCDPINISTILQDENCWYVQPLIFQGGKGHYRVMCQDRDGIRRAVKRMKNRGFGVELVSLKDFDFVSFATEVFLSSSSIFSGITEKQLGALTEAYSFGYFDEPKQVDMDYLANRAGISRSTYSEHLRKADSKIISNLAPLIKMVMDSRKVYGNID